MAQNIIDIQMKLFSMNIRRKIIAKLERSEENGHKIDEEFKNRLMNKSEEW